MGPTWRKQRGHCVICAWSMAYNLLDKSYHTCLSFQYGDVAEEFDGNRIVWSSTGCSPGIALHYCKRDGRNTRRYSHGTGERSLVSLAWPRNPPQRDCADHQGE